MLLKKTINDKVTKNLTYKKKKEGKEEGKEEKINNNNKEKNIQNLASQIACDTKFFVTNEWKALEEQ